MVALKYFGMYRFTLRMGDDPLWTALVIQRCSEVEWTKMALDDGFVSYDFESAILLELEEEVEAASKRARGVAAT